MNTPEDVKRIIREEARKAGVRADLLADRSRRGGPLSEARSAAIKRIYALAPHMQPSPTLALVGAWCGVSKQRAHQIVHDRACAMTR